MALLQSDVNVKYVGQLRNNVKKIVNKEKESAGNNIRRIIQQAVVQELVLIEF